MMDLLILNLMTAIAIELFQSEVLRLKTARKTRANPANHHRNEILREKVRVLLSMVIKLLLDAGEARDTTQVKFIR